MKPMGLQGETAFGHITIRPAMRFVDIGRKNHRPAGFKMLKKSI